MMNQDQASQDIYLNIFIQVQKSTNMEMIPTKWKMLEFEQPQHATSFRPFKYDVHIIVIIYSKQKL